MAKLATAALATVLTPTSPDAQRARTAFFAVVGLVVLGLSGEYATSQWFSHQHGIAGAQSRIWVDRAGTAQLLRDHAPGLTAPAIDVLRTHDTDGERERLATAIADFTKDFAALASAKLVRTPRDSSEANWDLLLSEAILHRDSVGVYADRAIVAYRDRDLRRTALDVAAMNRSAGLMNSRLSSMAALAGESTERFDTQAGVAALRARQAQWAIIGAIFLGLLLATTSGTKSLQRVMRAEHERDALVASLVASQNELQEQLMRHTGELSTSNAELIREIRRREAAQDANAINEARLRQIIDLVPHWIFAKDDEGTIVLANQASAKAYGITPLEMTGRRDSDIVLSAEEVERARQSDAQVLSGERQRYTYEEEVLLSSGERRIFSTSKAVLAGNDTARRAVVGVSIDITEQKRAEAEVHALNAELEERVKARTAELAAANRELESFAYSVSHDLRSPLRGIDGWSQALIEDYAEKLDEQGRTYLDWVRKETQRMGNLIDDLLALSRLGRAELHLNTVCISDLVSDQIARLRQREPQRVVDAAVAPAINVKGDPVLLGAVIQNLVENAWKFTGRRERARIEFGADRTNGTTTCWVRDDGAGFDMAYSKKLFAPFQRLHKASDFPGTGVGLASVQRIIQRHGGKIWAESAPNAGATFTFTLESAS